MSASKTTLVVDFRHLMEENKNENQQDLTVIIHNNYFKFKDFLLEALNSFVFNLEPNYKKEKLLFLSFSNLI